MNTLHTGKSLHLFLKEKVYQKEHNGDWFIAYQSPYSSKAFLFAPLFLFTEKKKRQNKQTTSPSLRPFPGLGDMQLLLLLLLLEALRQHLRR